MNNECDFSSPLLAESVISDHADLCPVFSSFEKAVLLKDFRLIGKSIRNVFKHKRTWSADALSAVVSAFVPASNPERQVMQARIANIKTCEGSMEVEVPASEAPSTIPALLPETEALLSCMVVVSLLKHKLTKEVSNPPSLSIPICQAMEASVALVGKVKLSVSRRTMDAVRPPAALNS
jgi:hypothetical protein